MVLRAKVLQLGCLVGAASPAVLATKREPVTFTDKLIVGTSCCGSLVVAATLNFLSRRFVGEMRVLRAEQRLVVSTLSVWGSRIDKSFPLASVVALPLPILRSRKAVPLTFADDPGTQHVVLLRDDHINDRLLLEQALSGSEIPAKADLEP